MKLALHTKPPLSGASPKVSVAEAEETYKLLEVS